MRRRLLNLLMAMSLLLGVAAAALRVRSYWRADCVTSWGTGGQLTAESRAGYLAFGKSNLYGDRRVIYYFAYPVGPRDREQRYMRSTAVHSLFGFVYGRDVRPGPAAGLNPELARRGLKMPSGLRRREDWYVPFWAPCALSQPSPPRSCFVGGTSSAAGGAAVCVATAATTSAPRRGGARSAA